MALDSIYRVKEVNKPVEIEPLQSNQDMKKLFDSLPTNDIDQQWIKEHEANENVFSTQKTDDEQTIDDILANFERIRESNNNMRSQKRNQQLNLEQQLQETQQWLDSMSGGKSR